MCKLVVEWLDYDDDGNEESYIYEIFCDDVREAHRLYEELDMSQYNGHEIVRYKIY